MPDTQITAAPIDLNLRITQFVKCKDLIKALKDKHQEELKPYMEAQNALEALLLSHLHSTGSNSATADSGTIYVLDKKSATVQDANVFRNFIITTENGWDLADVKANASNVEKYLTENKALPPGVNYTNFPKLGYRRA